MAGLLNFTPSDYGSMSASSGGNVAIIPTSGSPTTLLVTNLGAAPAALLLGTSSTMTPPTQATGVVVMPGQSVALGIGSNTYVAATALGFGNAQLNLAVGV